MKSAAPSWFAGSQLAETRHVCAFFNSEEEEYRVLLPFIKGGFECGHKAVHVVNAHQRSEHIKRLVGAGIDPAAAERSGQLELRTNTETYLRDGRSNAACIRTNRQWQCSWRISAEPFQCAVIPLRANDTVGPNQSILELAEACEVPLRWSCRTGGCHNCESGLVSGAVVYKPEPLDKPADGNVLVCCSQPIGDVVVDL